MNSHHVSVHRPIEIFFFSRTFILFYFFVFIFILVAGTVPGIYFFVLAFALRTAVFFLFSFFGGRVNFGSLAFVASLAALC